MTIGLVGTDFLNKRNWKHINYDATYRSLFSQSQIKFLVPFLNKFILFTLELVLIYLYSIYSMVIITFTLIFRILNSTPNQP